MCPKCTIEEVVPTPPLPYLASTVPRYTSEFPWKAVTKASFSGCAWPAGASSGAADSKPVPADRPPLVADNTGCRMQLLYRIIIVSGASLTAVPRRTAHDAVEAYGRLERQ